MVKLKKSKRIRAYFKKNKKREWEKTKIRISFKSEHQIPFAEILFEIE